MNFGVGCMYVCVCVKTKRAKGNGMDDPTTKRERKEKGRTGGPREGALVVELLLHPGEQQAHVLLGRHLMFGFGLVGFG